MKLPFLPSCKPNTAAPCAAVFNIDWLAFSVRLFETSAERDAHHFIFGEVPGCSVFELSGTNIYKRRLIVYDNDGRKMLTLLCEPHSRSINRLSALVQVANEWLYLGYSWLEDLLQYLHPCIFLCMSRLDLCADFQITDYQRDLIHKLSTNAAYVQGKRDGSAFFSYSMEETGVERTPRCISWGSKCSNIKWKVYHKSQEIFEPTKDGGFICSKPYIVTQWEDLHFDIMNVWRIEVSVNPMYKFEWHGKRVSLHDVQHTMLPMDLFCGLYQTRFVTRINEHHRDRSNDTRVHLLGDFGQTDRLRQYVNPDPQSLPVVEFAPLINSAVLHLSKPEVQANPTMFDTWVKVATDTCHTGHLESYFFKAYGYKIEDLAEKIRI